MSFIEQEVKSILRNPFWAALLVLANYILLTTIDDQTRHINLCLTVWPGGTAEQAYLFMSESRGVILEPEAVTNAKKQIADKRITVAAGVRLPCEPGLKIEGDVHRVANLIWDAGDHLVKLTGDILQGVARDISKHAASQK